MDEYGSLLGMVTVNDIFEAIVGLVPDAEGGSYLVEAQMPFIDFLDRLDRDPREFLEEDFSTLAGFILHQLQCLPATGDHLTWQNLRFEGVDMDDRRIDKVLVSEVAEAGQWHCPEPKKNGPFLQLFGKNRYSPDHRRGRCVKNEK